MQDSTMQYNDILLLQRSNLHNIADKIKACHHNSGYGLDPLLIVESKLKHIVYLVYLYYD